MVNKNNQGPTRRLSDPPLRSLALPKVEELDQASLGAPFYDDPAAGVGSAYVFARSGDVWSQRSKLVVSDKVTEDGFGSALARPGRRSWGRSAPMRRPRLRALHTCSR
jgi:hypothetical protein